MASKPAALIWIALAGVIAFVVFSPKNDNSQRKQLTAQVESVTTLQAAPLNVMFDFKVIANGGMPIVEIGTNLPPKIKLMGLLASSPSQGGVGYGAQAPGSVSNNHIAQFGPFSKLGEPIPAGKYQFTVNTVIPDGQSDEIKIFGINGANLQGSNVSTLPGTPIKFASQTFSFEIDDGGLISSNQKGTRESPPEDVALLIAKEERLNEKCRGGSGDDPATARACDEREAVLAEIKAKNWCWENDGQVGADRVWGRCKK
jgi:hypothetical protein